MKRSRGRGRRQQNPVNRSYDSNGPDARVRGTASQVYEKYQALARDAMSAGDRVMAENYQQHAEHYFRILQSFQPPASDNNDAASENAAAPIDGGSDANGSDANGQGANGASDGDAPADGNGGEPLVLVRGDDGDGVDGEGKEASKSRRRGPLGRKRKAKPSDTNADDAVSDSDMSESDASAAAAETADAGEGDAAISVE
ncbi:MAG: DUF4167 domain-containing protein [Alphaproteobacteria bacterium]|nr:DUF4167 domain-containing protein [Alphaproteobacteria bacterium]